MKKLFVATACIATAVFAATAQEAAKPGITNTLNAGFTLTDGNSETMLANGSIVSFGEKAGLGSFRAGIEGNYGESTVNSNKETTIENVRAYANVKKTITHRSFGYMDVSALYDDIAKVDYRVILNSGLGAYLVKRDRLAFSVEAGPAYVIEKVDGETDDYLALRLAERIDFTLSPTAKVWQSAEYLPKVDDFDAYLLNAELGVEAALNARLNLRVVLQDKYNSTPAGGLDKNDVALIAGISVAL